MKLRWFIILSLFLFITVEISVSYSQTKTPADTTKLATELRQVLRIAIDSALLIQQRNVDSLTQKLEKSLQTHMLSLQHMTDSLMKSSREFLDGSRIDSAYQLHKDFSGRLKTHGYAQQQALRNQLSEYKQTFIDLKNTHESCIDCTESEDFLNELSAFYEHADSSSDVFIASIVDRYDDASSSLSDSTGTLCDSLLTFVESLIDNREIELDSLEQHSNKLMISMDGNSFSFYHGRDGGVSQGIASPLVSFRHSSGVKLSLGISWLAEQYDHWDGSSVGLSYEFMFSPFIGGSIGYTHFWFDSSSTQLRAVFNQSVDGELDLSTPIADFSFAAEINFDHQSEYAFEVTATHNWEFGKKVVLAPTLKAAWGEQNLKLIVKQLQKLQQLNSKTIKTGTINDSTSTTNKSNIFSILDYEIVIPVSIRIGRWLFTPSVTAVFPLAIFDKSRTLPFLNAELTATIDWIW